MTMFFDLPRARSCTAPAIFRSSACNSERGRPVPPERVARVRLQRTRIRPGGTIVPDSVAVPQTTLRPSVTMSSRPSGYSFVTATISAVQPTSDHAFFEGADHSEIASREKGTPQSFPCSAARKYEEAEACREKDEIQGEQGQKRGQAISKRHRRMTSVY